MPEIPILENLLESFQAIGPQIHLIIWALGILCVDFLIPPGKKSFGAVLALSGLVMAAAQLYWSWSAGPVSVFFDMLTLDSFALYFDLLFSALLTRGRLFRTPPAIAAIIP